ncbi:hypothetical protein DSO57_1010610 [Entomophthora muscae]|uniref:Uncharacterized protein n=1 Tax=Entomophthora muscae TaxID=34485 RepID=A0ACC2RL93_9FUNG|nr:hypothetical protein DSO57_1010610 [Entomophthora muscae]
MWEETHGCNNQQGKTLALWLVLFLGMLLTYSTQMFKLIRLRRSQGLSYQYLVLRTLGRLYALCNVISYKANSIHCCAKESVSGCLKGITAIVFMLIQFILVWIIFVMFLAYFPKEKKVLGMVWRSKVFMSYMTLGVCFLSLMFTALLLPKSGTTLARVWIIMTGAFSTACSVAKLIPQIYQTWRTKEIGALSVTSLCLQTIGSTGAMTVLILDNGFSAVVVWIAYFLCAILELFLVLLCLVLKYSSFLNKK